MLVGPARTGSVVAVKTTDGAPVKRLSRSVIAHDQLSTPGAVEELSFVSWLVGEVLFVIWPGNH
jgi:hypothetical protein